MNMYDNNEIVPTIDFGEEEYKMAVEILKKKKIEKYYKIYTNNYFNNCYNCFFIA